MGVGTRTALFLFLTPWSPILFSFIFKSGWLRVCSAVHFTPDSSQMGLASSGMGEYDEAWSLVRVWLHFPSGGQGLREEISHLLSVLFDLCAQCTFSPTYQCQE